MDTILNARGIQSKREDYSSEKGLMKVFRYPSFPMAKAELEAIVQCTIGTLNT